MNPQLPVYLEVGDRYELDGDRFEVIDIVPADTGRYKFTTYIVTNPDDPIAEADIVKHGFNGSGEPIPKIEADNEEEAD